MGIGALSSDNNNNGVFSFSLSEDTPLLKSENFILVRTSYLNLIPCIKTESDMNLPALNAL